jgi:hypothetical protein
MSDKDWSSVPDAAGMGGYAIHVAKDVGATVYADRWHTSSTMRKMAIALLQAADYSEAQEHE